MVNCRYLPKLKALFLVFSRYRIQIAGLTIVTIATILVWLKMLLFLGGYLSFGNSLYPIDSTQIHGIFFESTIFGYNIFDYGGIVLPGLDNFPYFIENLANSSYLLFLDTLLPALVAVRLYILSLALVMSYSFFILMGRFTQKLIPRTVATLFAVLNPFQVHLIAYGDTGQMEQVAFLFLSLSFLIGYVRQGRNCEIYLLISIMFLLLVSPFFQAFVLGLVLYSVILAYRFFRIPRGRSITHFIYEVAPILLLLPVSLSLIWPFINSGYDLLPSSLYAPTLSNYQVFSENMANLLLLQGYSPFVPISIMQNSFGQFAEIGWLYCYDALLIFLLALFPLLSRDRKAVCVSILIVLFSLIGSDAKSPIAPITVWLFLHLPGYQALNTSYYWDWILISPLYALQLGFALNLLSDFRKSIAVEYRSGNLYYLLSKNLKNFSARYKITVIIVVLSLVALSFAPAVTQQYYSNSYVRSINLPTGYYQLPKTLKQYSGNNYTGVAFFNPDNLLYLHDSPSDGFNSPFFNMIPYKTYGVPNYAAPPLQSNYYALWAYYLFYTNQTHYIGDLLSVLGISLFVVLYNSNSLSDGGMFMPWSNNVNASHLMKYQIGVNEIRETANYAIYRTEFCNADSVSVSGLSIILGNYSATETLAAHGVNLSGLAPVFYPQLSTIGLFTIMPYVKQIFYQNGQLYDLAYSDRNLSIIEPDTVVQSSAWNINQTWVNSFRVDGAHMIFSSVSPEIVTNGTHSFNMSLNVNKTGPYTLWLDLLISTKGGKIGIISNGSTTFFNTTLLPTSSNYSSHFEWKAARLFLHEGANRVQVKSVKSYNSIQSIIYGPNGELSSFINRTLTELKDKGVTLISLSNLTKGISISSARPGTIYLLNSGLEVKKTDSVVVIYNSYFSTFDTSTRNYRAIPLFNGLETGIIGDRNGTVVVSFFPLDFYIYSIYIPLASIIGAALYVTYRRRISCK